MTLDDFLDDLRKVARRRDLWAKLLDFAAARGFPVVSYQLITLSPDQARERYEFRGTGFPREWVDGYMQKKLYRIDPISNLALSSGTSFLWSDLPNMVALDPALEDYFGPAATRRTGDGLAVPAFGPKGRNGLFGFGFGVGAAPISSARIIRDMRIAAQAMHLAYCALAAEADPAPQALSPRETEILGWIARGKSNSVIGEILGISPHTVDTMVRRLFLKLGVRDRVSAALKGVGGGLVVVDQDAA